MGLKQIIIGGNIQDNPANAVWDSFMGTSAAWGTPVGTRWECIPTGGTLSKLRVRLTAAPGGLTSRTYTVYVNGATTGLAVTISGADTTGSDITTNLSVAAGDTITMYHTRGGVPASAYATWTCQWESTIAGEGICCAMLPCSDVGGLRYGRIMGAGTTSGENVSQCTVPAGTFKKLFVALDVDPGTAPDAYRFTLMVDGVASALTTTITADNTTGNDIVNTVHVNAGQLVDIFIEPLNTPANDINGAVGLVFVPDDGKTSLIIGTSTLFPSTAAVTYNYLIGSGHAWDTTESNMYSICQTPLILKNMYLVLVNAPGAGKSWTLATRVNGAGVGSPAALAVTVSDAATSGSDLTNSYTIPSDGLTCGVECTPAGTPADPIEMKWTFGVTFKQKDWVQII